MRKRKLTVKSRIKKLKVPKIAKKAKRTKEPKKIDTPKKTNSSKKRTKKFSSNKLIVVILIVVVALAITGCGVGYYFNELKMEEISIDDELVTELYNRYLRGKDVCLDYKTKIFGEGKVSAKDMDYNTKEEIVIDYLAKKGYRNIGFNEMKESYRMLFNDGSELIEKDYYSSASGNYEKDGNQYILYKVSQCSSRRPYEMICLVPDKAYKSNHALKVVAGLYSGTADTQNLYSGINWEGEPLGVFGEINPVEKDLVKWEIVFKYDNKLNRFFLDYTKKL